MQTGCTGYVHIAAMQKMENDGYSSCTGNFMSSLQVYHCKLLLLDYLSHRFRNQLMCFKSVPVILINAINCNYFSFILVSGGLC